MKKLHDTDKARHDTEIRLLEEINKTKDLSETVKTKDDSVLVKERQIEEMDKKNLDLQRQNEQIETKKQGIERQLELYKKQSTEKINNLQDIIVGEKDTRLQWVERYEKEQADNNIKTAQLN